LVGRIAEERAVKIFNAQVVFTIIALLAGSRSTPAVPQAKPEMVLQLGHSSEVTAVSYSSDGQQIASADENGMIGLWMAQSGEITGRIAVATRRINALVFDPAPHSFVLYVGTNEGIQVWDARKRKLLRVLSHKAPSVCNALAISSNGSRLASGHGLGRIQIWDTHSWRVLKVLTFKPHEAGAESSGQSLDIATLIFSPDGRSLISGTRNSGTVIWNLASGQIVQRFSKRGNVSSLTRDGRFLAVAQPWGGRIDVFRVRDGQLQSTLESPAEDGAVNGLAFSRDGQTLFSAAYWNISMSTPRALWHAWNWQSGQARWKTTRMVGHPNSLDISPQTNQLVVADGGVLEVRDANRGQRRWKSQSRPSFDDGLEFSPRSSTLWVGNGHQWRWPLRAGVLAPAYDGRQIAYSPDGARLAVAGFSPAPQDQIRTVINIRNAANGQVLVSWQSQPHQTSEYPMLMRFSPNGRFLAIGYYHEHAAAVSHYPPSGGRLDILDTTTDKIIVSQDDGFAPISQILWSNDNKTLFVSDRQTVRRWELSESAAKWERHEKFRSEIINDAIALSSDEKRLTTLHSFLTSQIRVTALDAQTGKKEKTLFSQAAYLEDRTAAALSENGQQLAIFNSKPMAGADSPSVELWNLATKTLSARLPFPNENFSQLQFSRNENGSSFPPLLAGTSQDGTIYLWNLSNGKLALTLSVLSFSYSKRFAADWIAFTPDGFYTGSKDCEKFIRWRVGGKLLPAAEYSAQLRRPDLVALALK
jgi:WD40 repeat protein